MQDDKDRVAQRAILAASFGKRLRSCRHRTCLSQEELAAHAHLHRTEVGLLEGGRREPKLSTVIKLAYALDISATDLLRGAAWTPERGFKF